MLVKSLMYKGFSGELDGVETDKNKEKNGLLGLIKKLMMETP